MKNKHTYPALLVALFLHCTMVSFGKQASKSILLQNDTTTVKRYIDQAYALHQQNLDTAVFISQKALKLARKLKWEKGVAQAYYDQGWYYRCKTDFDRSIACYENALNHYTILSKSAQKKQRHSGNLGIHKTLSGIGGVYMAAGNYTKALQLQFKALKLGEKLGIDKHIVLINIAQVYFYQGKFEKAKPYFEKSLGIAKKLGDKDVILANLQNLGAMAGMQGKHQEALRYHKSVLKLAHEMNANVTVAMTLANIGTEFQYQENHDSAEYYFKNALKMCEAYGSKGDVASLNGSLGLLAISRGKFAQAEQFLMRANTLALETGSLELIKASYKDLHDFYDTAHKAEMALKSYELYIAYSDSIANSENVKLQARVEMQYEFDKKHAADSLNVIEITKREKMQQDQEIVQQKMYTFGGIIGFGLMVVVAIISLRASRQKKKDNLLIAEQKTLVEEKQREILDSIHYAKRIQRALLPSEKYISRNLKK